MPTSGTVATTLITVDKIIEHAIRRCRLNPTVQNNETMQIARENLYLIMLGLANRGLQLWCVETVYVGLKTNKATYEMPDGTIDVLNLIYSRPQRAEGTDSSTGTSFTTQLDEEIFIGRIGLKFTAIPASNTITLQSSTNGIAWTTIQVITKTDWSADTWYWLNLDPAIEDVYFRVSSIGAITVDEFYLANSIYDQYIDKYNRDDYFNLPNKQTSGSPCTNYYYERKTNPQVTLWPVPNNDYDHLTVVRHRQIQDIGAFTNEIELPNRWLEGIIWQLAERLAFELTSVDPALMPSISAMAVKTFADIEVEETDGADISIMFRISGYTK